MRIRPGREATPTRPEGPGPAGRRLNCSAVVRWDAAPLLGMRPGRAASPVVLDLPRLIEHGVTQCWLHVLHVGEIRRTHSASFLTTGPLTNNSTTSSGRASPPARPSSSRRQTGSAAASASQVVDARSHFPERNAQITIVSCNRDRRDLSPSISARHSAYVSSRPKQVTVSPADTLAAALTSPTTVDLQQPQPPTLASHPPSSAVYPSFRSASSAPRCQYPALLGMSPMAVRHAFLGLDADRV